MSFNVVDIFAGPGGWSEGMRQVGLSPLGIEWDPDACLTRRAAGHVTIRADVAEYPAEPFRGMEGLVASPPCQAFSLAGKGLGRKDLPLIHARIRGAGAGWTDELLEGPWQDARSPLILQPLRWAWEVRPTWVACEQVPECMQLWEHMADVLRGWGYQATAVKLVAADYGVPQTRRRAFLLAHREELRVAPPSHAKEPQPGLFGERERWVSMADALGWSGELIVNQKPPRQDDNNQENAAVRGVDSPAPTMLFSRGNTAWWGVTRPATTIQATDRVGRPGRKDFEAGESQFQEGSVPITQEEAAILQGFRPDYPFQGTKTSRFQQIGNAVPPTWAAAIIRALAGR